MLPGNNLAAESWIASDKPESRLKELCLRHSRSPMPGTLVRPPAIPATPFAVRIDSIPGR